MLPKGYYVGGLHCGIAKNKKDLVDIPKRVQRELDIVFVDEMDTVLKTALIVSRKKKRKGKTSEAEGKSSTKADATLANSQVSLTDG